MGSGMDAAVGSAGNQAGATSGFHTVEGDGDTVDEVSVTAFDNWERSLAHRCNRVAASLPGYP